MEQTSFCKKLLICWWHAADVYTTVYTTYSMQTSQLICPLCTHTCLGCSYLLLQCPGECGTCGCSMAVETATGPTPTPSTPSRHMKGRFAVWSKLVHRTGLLWLLPLLLLLLLLLKQGWSYCCSPCCQDSTCVAFTP